MGRTPPQMAFMEKPMAFTSAGKQLINSEHHGHVVRHVLENELEGLLGFNANVQ